MIILQTIPNMGAISGGPTMCTYELVNAINSINDCVQLATLDVANQNDTIIGKGADWMILIPDDAKSLVEYSPNLKSFLKNSSYDLYHTNGLWLYCNHITCMIARKRRRPYVITTHGMLYPKALRRSFWKKKPLLEIWFKKDIMRANCLHATCEQEMRFIREFGYKRPIAVIPNPLPVCMDAEHLFTGKQLALRQSEKKRVFGYLGRLHPTKRIENILYGAATMKDKSQFEIIIIGEGDHKYEQFLRNEIERLSLPNVSFAGFIKGEEKYALLSKLSALFVPSDFENFGMVVTEALSVGTPVMASFGTPWEELNLHACGWWGDCSPNAIASVMNSIIDMPVENLLQMGKRGMQLVESKYSSSVIASQMLKLYGWILNGGEKPDFVYD